MANTAGFRPSTARKKAAKLDLSVVGTSGLKRQGGRIENETLARLRGGRGPLLYREMADNSAVVGAILYVVRTWLTQVDWYFKPADEQNPDAVFWAEFMESCREDTSHTWTDFISEVLSYPVYGWCLIEICYKQRLGPNSDPTKNSRFTDGMVGWRKFSLRAQDTLDEWVFDDNEGIRGMKQRAPNWSAVTEIPIEKCMLFRSESTANNPEGRSMLRNAVRPYLFVKRIEEFEGTGVERDLAGLPKVEVPLALFDTEGEGEIVARNKRVLQQLLETGCGVRRDERECVVVPCEEGPDGKTGFKFSLMNSGGARQHNTDLIIRRYESRIAMVLVAEFILLGTDKTGSWSMYSGKTDTFAVALRAMLKNIRDVIQRYAVARLCAYNGCPPDLVPTIQHGDVAAPPLAEIGQFIQQMSAAGMIMYDKASERWVRGKVGMPEPEEDPLSQPLEEDPSQGSPDDNAATDDPGANTAA